MSSSDTGSPCGPSAMHAYMHTCCPVLECCVVRQQCTLWPSPALPGSPSACHKTAPQSCRRGAGALAFIERHRTLLNAYIAAQPSTIEGAFAPLLATPRLLDFANKAKHFRAHMRRLRTETRGGLPLSLRRRSTFEESFRQLKGKSAEEMRAPLNVKFHGEEAIDAGAVQLPPGHTCRHRGFAVHGLRTAGMHHA